MTPHAAAATTPAPGVRRPVVFLALALGAAAVVLTLVTVTARRTYRTLDAATRRQAGAYDMLVALRLLRQHIGETRVGLSGYALTRDTIYLATYERAIRELGNDTARLTAQAAAADLVRPMSDVSGAVAAYARDMAAGMNAMVRGPSLQAQAEVRRGRGTLLLEGTRTRIVALEQTLAGTLDSSAAGVRASVGRANAIITWALLLGMLVVATAGGAVLAQLMARERVQVRLRRLNVDLEDRVRHRTSELADANRELEAFVSAAAHDLRAPLRAIEGYGRILADEHAAQLGDAGRSELGMIRAAGTRMAHLIDDLLALSRAGRTELHREPVDLSALVHAIAAELHKREPARAVNFAVADGVTAQADAKLMRVVLDNLIGNAWKYTRGRAGAQIEFGATRSDGGATRYFVKDNGAGFDMRYVHKIFEPFERLHSMAEFEGTGVGLTTVQRIVHRHGGEVFAEGAVDQGATISFTLGVELS